VISATVRRKPARPRRCTGLWLALCTTTRLAAAQSLDAWLAGDDLTGDWGGVRRGLDERGVHLDLDYTADTFGTLATSGDEKPAAYRGTIDLMLTLDSEKLELWPGGTLFIYGQNGHGGGISTRLGTAMPISNLEAPAFTQVSELWYEQGFFSGRLSLKLGKQDANRDFAAPRFPGNFVHSSFGAPPSSPMPTFPAPGWGAAVFFEPVPWFGLRSGIYQSQPKVEALGLQRAFDAGPFAIAAALARHDLLGLPQAAIYSVGGWYRDEHPESSEGSGSSCGALATADVLLPVVPGARDDSRTFQGFVRLGWSSPDDGAITLYIGGGATYHGLRGNDTLGLGGGHVRFRDTTVQEHRHESFVELFYKARFTDWFSVQPDLQLIVHPGGANDTALLGGVRLKVKL
jgi:porin